MENPPLKVDREKSKLHGKLKFDYREELQKMGADLGYVKYCLANAFVLPFDIFASSNPSGAKKLRHSNWKRIYRREKARGGDWKDRLKEIRKRSKDLRKTQYIQTLFGFEPINVPSMRNPRPTKPSQNRLLAAVWMLKTYFERLTKGKSKKGKGQPCWELIAELLELIHPIRFSARDLASWWGKRRRDFEPWDGDALLVLDLAFYQRHKLELDSQCTEWLRMCQDWLTEIEESEEAFQKTIEKYKDFSKE